MPQRADLTLAEIRSALAGEVVRAAAFDGWGEAALAEVARKHGIDPNAARLAFSGGAMAMISAWIASVDAAMQDRFGDGSLLALPVRTRIQQLVRFRLEAIAGLEESLRRALAIMAMPQNAAQSLRMGWNSADAMWRLAGDTATDYNHYTKRTILAGLYAATVTIFVGDDSEGKTETLAFLDRRIEGVMRFEKAKTRLLRPDAEHFSIARLLGRLRYPAI